MKRNQFLKITFEDPYCPIEPDKENDNLSVFSQIEDMNLLCNEALSLFKKRE